MIAYWDDLMLPFSDHLELYARGGNSAVPPGPPGEALRAWLKDCPIPTIEQTTAFSHEVAKAHSWYKHLPLLPPGARFAFLLDPHSGMTKERIGHRKIYRPDPEALKDHEAFGTWIYFVDFDNMPGRLLTAEDPNRPDRPEMPEHGSYGLPTACFARFTAFLRPTTVLAAVCAIRLAGQIPLFDQWARENPSHPDVARYAPFRAMAEGILAKPGSAWKRMSGFAESEGAYQRRHLTESLLSAREAWIQFLGTAAIEQR